jgi:hypothetical protein
LPFCPFPVRHNVEEFGHSFGEGKLVFQLGHVATGEKSVDCLRSAFATRQSLYHGGCPGYRVARSKHPRVLSLLGKRVGYDETQVFRGKAFDLPAEAFQIWSLSDGGDYGIGQNEELGPFNRHRPPPSPSIRLAQSHALAFNARGATVLA